MNTWSPPGRVQAEYVAKARAQDRAFGLAQAAPGSGFSGHNSTIGLIQLQLNAVAPVRVAVVGLGALGYPYH